MELRIKEVSFPEAIEFNFDEIKQELEEKVKHYKGLVYTDDQIKDAKADIANVRKFAKALSDERIRMKKQCLQPYEAFEAKVAELTAIVSQPISLIDMQVKEYEEKKKQDKRDAITAFFNSTDHPEWLKLSKIFDDKWLNASVSMKSVQDAIDARLEQIKIDLATLSNLPEFGFEATEEYKCSLDINRSISEGHRLSEIARKKAEHEAEQERLKKETEFAKAMNPPVEEEVETHVVECGVSGSIKTEVVKEAPEKTWVQFATLMTVDQARELQKFFDDRCIEFKAI